MKVSFDIPDTLDALIMAEASKDGHRNRAAVIRKAIGFYFNQKSPKVATTSIPVSAENK